MVRKSKFKIFRDILLLLITLAVLFFAGKGMIKSVVSDSQPFKSEEAGELDADSNTYMLKPMEPEQMFDGLDLYQYIEGQYTVLCLGMDEEGLNTDIMMLAQFDLNAAKINILQIPRDCYVGPDYTKAEHGKINSVYSDGVCEGSTPVAKVANCLKDLFGIPIDAYIGIKCTDVPPVVDAIGGIPINVPYDIIYEADKIIYKGEQVLDGQHSEWFVRFRHDYLEGDIARIRAQRIFLAAGMQKVKNLGTLKVLSIYPTLKQYLMSDLDISEIGILCDFAQTVPMENVTVRMVPGEDLSPGDINNYSGYSIHEQETVDMLNEYFRPYQEEMTAEQLNITEVKHTAAYYDNDSTNFADIENGDVPSVPFREDANKLESDTDSEADADEEE
ncbi:MAG: LCP family protein [Oscillospiraceae bacterium]|nr:LCP family protein [Oscillospiraceae bacterium]